MWRRREVDLNHRTDLPFEGSAESHVSKERYEPVAISSGNRTNCAPWATACSAKAVARLRFASMSWSTDCIWTTAIRSDCAFVEAGGGPSFLVPVCPCNCG